MNTLDIHTLPPNPSAGSRLHWGGLQGALPSLLLARAATRFDGLSLVITENSLQAGRLLEEMQFFLDGDAAATGLEVLEFPDWETLPYDNFSPH